MNIHEGAPLEPHEQEGALVEQIKEAFKEIERDLREIERLAAAVAHSPEGSDFGFQDDLSEVLNGAKTKFEDLVASMIERGRARGEIKEDPNQDLFK